MKKIKIQKNKVAVVSDIHAGIYQNSKQWHDIFINWYNWFYEECKKHEVKDIIIPGDVFHHRNEINVQTLHVVYNFFKKFEDLNIVVLVGNHDAYYKEDCRVHSLSIFNEWENVTVVDEVTTVSAFNKKITICPWGTELSSIPESDIIFGHFELNGFNMTKTEICKKGITSSDILNKAPLVITGHFHIRDERKYDKGTIIYVGSAFEMDWGDLNTERGYHILDIKTNDMEFYKNDITPKHKRINLSDIIESGVTKEVKQLFKGNWVKINIDKDLDSEKVDSIITKLSSLKPFSLTTEKDSYSSHVEIDIDYGGVDIEECIQEYVNVLEIEYKEDVVEQLLELYNSVKTHV